MIRSRSTRPALLLAIALALPGAACAQQDAGAARAAEAEARYASAATSAEAAVAASPDDPAARRALIAALMELGRYDEAIASAGPLDNLRGEALWARGRLEEAEEAFRAAAADAAAPDRLTAELNLAVTLHESGRRDEAARRFDAFIDLYNRSASLGARELIAVGDAVAHLGATQPELFQDAVMAFDEAAQLDPTEIDAHLRLADLFLEKYNSAEARTAIDDALGIEPGNPRALLGLARAHAFDGDRGSALESVRESLAVNPNLVPARVFLARLLMDAEDYAGADEELRRALDVNPASRDALATLAALHFVQGDMVGFADARARVAAHDPTYAGVLTTAAELAGQQRQYTQAMELAEEATRVDPASWEAWGALGLNQFRLGQIADARASLEHSFSGDPYNVWIKNNLDLLDTFERYRMIELSGLEIMVHEDEAELLLPYVEVAATRAHAELSARYGDRPRGPVRIELYPRSADFSVRTVGLAGLGALGVSFGDVVALDSPGARQAGSYSWITTLWHELAHTAAMGVTDNRIPRWLAEGLAVLDEQLAHGAGQHDVTPEFLLAYDAGELPPASRLGEGFSRPRTPAHLGFAYSMAALVARWIEETRGFDSVLALLAGYRDGADPAALFQRVLGSDPAGVDAAFDTWLRAAHPPGNAGEFMTLMEAGRYAYDRGELNDARRTLERAADLFPIASSGSPYALLARIHLDSGDREAAIEALRALTAHDATAYQANLELARLLEAADDIPGAAAALDRAVWIFPYEPEPHRQLADHFRALGDYDGEVRERRAIVGLHPTDEAGARYQLARALADGGDAAGARREVLRALELAPAFEEAQQLLLRLHEGT